ncbi:MAG: helix-turn-helix domain-containing protein [Fimbriiglobus sp.]
MPKSVPNQTPPAVSPERLRQMRGRAAVGRAEFASTPGLTELAAAEADGGIAAFQDVLRRCVAQLKAAREAAGLSLADVSRLTDIAPESLSRLETGATMNPTWKTLCRVAAAVGLELKLSAEPK